MVEPVRAKDGRIILRKQTTSWLITTLRDCHAAINSPTDCFSASDLRNYCSIAAVLMRRGIRFENGLPVTGG